MLKKLSIALLLITNLQSQCWWFWPFSAPSVVENNVYVAGQKSEYRGSNVTYNREVKVMGQGSLSSGSNSNFNNDIRISGQGGMYVGSGSSYNGPIHVSGQSVLRTGMFGELNGKVTVTGQGAVKIGLFSKWPTEFEVGQGASISTDYWTPAKYIGGICLLGFLANSYRK